MEDTLYAYPSADGPFGEWHRGMTLRDHFAGCALSSGFARDTVPEWQLRAWFGDRTSLRREEIIAMDAYTIADAMIKARGG